MSDLLVFTIPLQKFLLHLANGLHAGVEDILVKSLAIR